MKQKKKNFACCILVMMKDKIPTQRSSKVILGLKENSHPFLATAINSIYVITYML